MTEVVEVPEGVSQDQFNRDMEKLEKFFSRTKENLIKAAPILAKFSPKQMDEVKERFKSIITATMLDKIRAVGRGEIDTSLLILCDDRTITIEKLRKMSPEARKLFGDPHKDVRVYNPSNGKTVIKEFGQLTSLERRNVVDVENERFRSPGKQKEWWDGQKKPTVQPKMLVFDGCEVEGELTMVHSRYRDDEPGTRRFTTPVPGRIETSKKK